MRKVQLYSQISELMNCSPVECGFCLDRVLCHWKPLCKYNRIPVIFTRRFSLAQTGWLRPIGETFCYTAADSGLRGYHLRDWRRFPMDLRLLTGAIDSSFVLKSGIALPTLYRSLHVFMNRGFLSSMLRTVDVKTVSASWTWKYSTDVSSKQLLVSTNTWSEYESSDRLSSPSLQLF